MITKVILPLILFLVATDAISGNGQERDVKRDETRSIEGLPFCALVVGDFYDKDQRERTIDVLMEPGQVTDSNLGLLFRILSDKLTEEPALTIWVNTDIRQLATLATGTGGSGPAQGKRIFQLAYYRRTNTVELFRYNPNYPKAGEKTIIIRGKED
ncbi:MAG: hypothetical protein AABO57_27570 [Acidobacteriota bacterium]